MTDAKLTTVIVVKDAVAWREPIPGTVPPKFHHLNGYRGQKVQMGPAALERHLKLGGVALPKDADAAIAAEVEVTGVVAAGAEGDAQLSAMDSADLIAYVTQNPGEGERVNRLERDRKRGPRKTVVAAAGYDFETGELLEPTE